MPAPVRRVAPKAVPVDLTGPPTAPVEKVPPTVPAIPTGWRPPDPTTGENSEPADTDPLGPLEMASVPDPDPDANAVAAEALRSRSAGDPAVDDYTEVDGHVGGVGHVLDENGRCEQCDPPAPDPTDDDPNAYVNLSDVLAAVAGLRDDVDRLTAGVRIIGEQQQFMTNSMTEALNQFQQMMGAGGPMKMLGAMFGNRKGSPQ